MSARRFTNLLVLRQDTATGMAKVGWDTDMPIGRFKHIALIGETHDAKPIHQHHPLHQAYCSACEQARLLNLNIINQQRGYYCEHGCIQVPLDLQGGSDEIDADPFGNYYAAAMRTLFRLTANKTQVWIVLEPEFTNQIVAILPRQPPRNMDTLEYQVWKHACLTPYTSASRKIVTGELFAAESGLWFRPDSV